MRIVGLIIIIALVVDLLVAVVFGSSLGITIRGGGGNPPPTTGTLYFAAYNVTAGHYVAALVSFTSKPVGAPSSVSTVASDVSPWGVLNDVPIGTYVATCTYNGVASTQGSVTINLLAGNSTQTTFTFGSGPPPPTYLFTDGFEESIANGWTVAYHTNGTYPVQSSTVFRTGTHSGGFTTIATLGQATSYVSKTVTAMNAIYVRAYMYVSQPVLSTMLANDRFYLIWMSADAPYAGNNEVDVGIRREGSNSLKWVLWRETNGTSGQQIYGSTVVTAIPEWTCIELYWDRIANQVKVWINGNVEITDTAIIGSSLQPIVHVDIGIFKPGVYNTTYDPTGQYPINLYVDDVVFNNAYIGPSTGGGLSIFVLPFTISPYVTIDVLWFVALAAGVIMMAMPRLSKPK